MAIVLLYSFHIVLARRDSVSAGRELPFQFDKLQNFVVFGFKTIIFDKFMVYYRFFIVFYWISIKFLLFNIKFPLNSIVLGRYDRGIL